MKKLAALEILQRVSGRGRAFSGASFGQGGALRAVQNIEKVLLPP
jgi:hypothetical protein